MFRVDLKIYSLIVVLSIIFLVSNAVAFAHGPSGMDLGYDKANQNLEVNITHTVDSPDAHYVENVIISINGETVESETYTSQPTNSSFSYTYDVSAEEGDTIQVKAICNQYGSISDELVVSSDSGDQENGGGGMNTLLIIGMVIAVIIVIGAIIHIKR